MNLEVPQPSTSPSPPGADHEIAPQDVVVIGGGLVGASFALLLQRRLPGRRVTLVELSETHPHRLGEATVEVSGCFLARVLGLYEHLAREHQPKHGLRYWHSDHDDRTLAEMSEVGSTELPHLPSFQLDRQILDEHVLAEAEAAGCEVLRPAKVTTVDTGWPTSTVEVELADGRKRALTTRWVIDASGRRAFLARRKRLLEKVPSHPTAAVWGWWRGVKDIDAAIAEVPGAKEPGVVHLPMSRRLATNHFCGHGWWIWMIPQSDGETSLGLVYDKRLFELPGSGPKRERYEAFLRSRPGLGELLADATFEGGSFGAYAELPYRSRRYMDRGWALVGDAASFLDPYYSPGLDHAAISINATLDLVAGDLEGTLDDDALGDEIQRHNGEFERSYDRWLEALYLDKYEILGDSELTACAFLVDTALYHLGVVTPIYRQDEAFTKPVFGLQLPQARIAYKMMAAFNRRMVVLARHRRRVGTYGRRNVGRRLAGKAFGLGVRGTFNPLRRGLGLWFRLELARWTHPLRRGLGLDPPPQALASDRQPLPSRR